jgi:hypothetical protein
MKYIYAVIPSGKKMQFGSIGFGDGDPRVYTVPYRDLSAVVSDRRAINYQTLPRAEILRDLTIHQKTVEKVMEHFTVLPIKFGTLMPDSADVIHILHEGYDLCWQTLTAIKGRVEVEVVATWDLKAVFQEIANEEPIAARKTLIATRVPTETAKEYIEIGRMVKESLEARRAHYHTALLAALMDCADEVRVNPLLTDEMVMNAAFLVDRQGWQKLDDAVREQDHCYNGALNFRCIGPLPAYSFATLGAKRLTPQEVKRARQLLQLPERASLRQVKAAYHRLARKFHPDLNPEDTSAQTHPSTGSGQAPSTGSGQVPSPSLRGEPVEPSGHRFDEAHKAYQILVDYCMSQLDGNRSNGAADQGRVVSFAPADVRGAFLVAISQSTTA